MKRRKVGEGRVEDKCVCCGAIVPEGRMVCPVCTDKLLQEKEQTNKFSRFRGCARKKRLAAVVRRAKSNGEVI